MAVEQTLILAKPDAIRRSLGGEIVARFERRGFRLRAARLLVVDRALAEEHYADAEPGSIRGDYASAMPDNLVHGSDSPESAEREIALWFPDGLV